MMDGGRMDKVKEIDHEGEWQAFRLPEETEDGRLVFELMNMNPGPVGTTYKVILVPVEEYDEILARIASNR